MHRLTRVWPFQVHDSLRAELNAIKRVVKHEMKATSAALAHVQQQAVEFAIEHNKKDMALAARQSKLIQVQSQLKNERLKGAQTQAELRRVTHIFDRKYTQLEKKYEETKDHLEITLAGMTVCT